MKYILLIFSLFLIILCISCTTESTTSCEKLATENRMLRDSIAKLEASSTMKSEAIVELEKMNIVYRGVDNPVKISVPNALKFSVMAPGLKNKGNGHFVLRPQTGKEVTFKIIADMRNGERLEFEKVFRIEDIGAARVFFNDKLFQNCFHMLSKHEIATGTITVDIGNYLPYKRRNATGFTSIFIGKNKFEIKGNKFSKEAIKELDNMSVGDTIIINSIKVPFESDIPRTCKPPSFYIVISND